jgi:hypothetical protein
VQDIVPILTQATMKSMRAEKLCGIFNYEDREIEGLKIGETTARKDCAA